MRTCDSWNAGEYEAMYEPLQPKLAQERDLNESLIKYERVLKNMELCISSCSLNSTKESPSTKASSNPNVWLVKSLKIRSYVLVLAAQTRPRKRPQWKAYHMRTCVSLNVWEYEAMYKSLQPKLAQEEDLNESLIKCGRVLKNMELCICSCQLNSTEKIATIKAISNAIVSLLKCVRIWSKVRVIAS